jgi:hypothetical protein
MKLLVCLIAGAAMFAAASCDPSDPEQAAWKAEDPDRSPAAVQKTYGLPAGEMMDVVGRALQSYELQLDLDVRTPMGGEMTAHRSGGHQVEAKIGAVDAGSTRVSIRVTPGNRRMSELIHDRIARILHEEPQVD